MQNGENSTGIVRGDTDGCETHVQLSRVFKHPFKPTIGRCACAGPHIGENHAIFRVADFEEVIEGTGLVEIEFDRIGNEAFEAALVSILGIKVDESRRDSMTLIPRG